MARSLLLLSQRRIALLVSIALLCFVKDVAVRFAFAQDSSHRSNQLAMKITGVEVLQQGEGKTAVRVLTVEEAEQMQAQSEQGSSHRLKENLSLNGLTTDDSNLKIQLSLSTRITSDPAVKAAVERVAARWAAIIKVKKNPALSRPFQLNVSVDFDDTAFGRPFASPNSLALSTFYIIGFNPIVTYAELFDDLTNYRYQSDLAKDLPDTIFTDFGDSRNLTWSHISGFALGLDFHTNPATTIAINSGFKFDFDPSDGIDVDKLDFESILSREFGRILGFFSSVDVLSLKKPYENPFGGIHHADPTLWDLYRLRPGVTREDFTTATRIQSATGEQIFFTGDLEAPLAVARFSPTEFNSSRALPNFNRAAGYWRDDALTGQYYGIMDESYLPGERGGITALEVGALSYFCFAVAPDTPVFEVLSEDDNGREAWLPASSNLLVQRLTPKRAPANLESVRVSLPPDAVGKQLRIVAWADATRTGQPAANPALLVDRTITVSTLPAHGMLEVMLPAPVVVPRGDLYVGVQSVNGNFTFAADTSAPRGRAFVSTNNGASFTPLTAGGAPANAILRAAINTRFNTVGNHPPEIASLSTNTAPAGSSFALTVFGAHYYPDSDDAAGLVYKSTIRVNGRDVATTFLAASQLRANLNASDLGTGPTARVTVATQTPLGVLESNAVEIALSNAAPVPALVRLDPQTVAVAGGAFGQKTIQVTGRNFTAATQARVGAATRTTKYLSDTKLEVTLNDADLAQAGTLALTTVNAATAAGGGGASNALTLTVAGCSYAFPSAGRAYAFAPSGETLDSVLLDTPDHCPWTVSASASWIRLEGPTKGVGRAPIPFTVVNNAGGGGRTGTITVSAPGQSAQTFLISQPSGLTAVSSANYADISAVGAIATIFSSGLSAVTQGAVATPLPTTLGGTRVVVRVNGLEYDCPLFYVSPTQINFQVSPAAPLYEVDNNFVLQAPLTVLRDGVAVAQGILKLANVVPSLFTADATGQGVPAGLVLRVRANGTQAYEPLAEFSASQQRYVAREIDLGPAGDRVFLVLFGTGFRRRSSLENVLATGGGIQLGVSYAGAQGELVGVDQLNAELPRELTGRGDVPVQLLIDNRSSNRVTIRVK